MRSYRLLVLVCLVLSVIGSLLGLRMYLAIEDNNTAIKVESVNGLDVNYREELPTEVISEQNVAAAWAAQKPKKGGLLAPRIRSN